VAHLAQAFQPAVLHLVRAIIAAAQMLDQARQVAQPALQLDDPNGKILGREQIPTVAVV